MISSSRDSGRSLEIPLFGASIERAHINELLARLPCMVTNDESASIKFSAVYPNTSREVGSVTTSN
jgi:hypothetical protein